MLKLTNKGAIKLALAYLFVQVTSLHTIGYTIDVVNKGRRVTLKYFSKLIKINRERRLFVGPGKSIRLIYFGFFGVSMIYSAFRVLHFKNC